MGLALAGAPWFGAIVAPLERLGWRFRGMNGDDPRRRYFVRDAADGRRVAQLHVYALPAAAWGRHLAFRDALRADPAFAAAYWAEKQRAAAATGWDKSAYALEKGPWIATHLSTLTPRDDRDAPRPR